MTGDEAVTAGQEAFEAANCLLEDCEDSKDLLFDLNITAHGLECFEPRSWSASLPGETFFAYAKRSICELQARIPQPPPKQIQAVRNREGKRPLCQEINMTDSSLDQLKGLFFDHQGRLRRDLRGSVDFGDRNGYIVLQEKNERKYARRDFRWILPLLLYDNEPPICCLVNKIAILLSSQGLIDLQHEILHDVSVLIGGTTYQYLHHDFEKSDETDDKDLDEAINGAYSPASILIGLGTRDDPVRLAVAIDEVNMTEM